MFKKRDKDKEWRDGVYLCTVYDTIEADILESKLLSENIPCIRNYEGAGNYAEIVLGRNFATGIEIYVPSDALEDAKNIIVPVDLEDCEYDDTEE